MCNNKSVEDQIFQNRKQSLKYRSTKTAFPEKKWKIKNVTLDTWILVKTHLMTEHEEDNCAFDKNKLMITLFKNLWNLEKSFTCSSLNDSQYSYWHFQTKYSILVIQKTILFSDFWSPIHILIRANFYFFCLFF